MDLQDYVIIALLVMVYLSLGSMTFNRIMLFKAQSKTALLKVSSKQFFFSEKMHNLFTLVLVGLLLVQLVMDIQAGRYLYGGIFFIVVVFIILKIHFTSMSSNVWAIREEGLLLYGYKEIIPWSKIKKYTWDTTKSDKYNELYIVEDKNEKSITKSKKRLIVDKSMMKDVQKLFKKYKA
ncbi:hypothetical protein RH915_06335 [Serpentinicella sp. ANB-PHB4]|uniref:hypothetical protein n=1 Tax=Serpentinicella sp. ANB-PHB4 TaxID=3074076 RepID=UPI0028657358|nr:hypothetical protein [Serpentinicella sp. ANB-PHB4]MDR5659101.1 hypothetical protein [Serpentinicella sp. ANB-PHB4]